MNQYFPVIFFFFFSEYSLLIVVLSLKALLLKLLSKNINPPFIMGSAMYTLKRRTMLLKLLMAELVYPTNVLMSRNEEKKPAFVTQTGTCKAPWQR